MTRQAPPANGTRRRRSLSSDEAQLWQTVIRSVRPIAGKRELHHDGPQISRADGHKPGTGHAPVKPEAGSQAKLHPGANSPAATPGGSKSGKLRPASVGLAHSARPAAPKAPELANFDLRAARKLATGQHEIEARLDLHGMRQSEAHAALRRFLVNCQAQGLRYVKVITGKGSSDGETDRHAHGPSWMDAHERGVLRRAVPQWLAEAEFRSLVVSHTSAGRSHGGDGALYIQIRRAGRAIARG